MPRLELISRKQNTPPIKRAIPKVKRRYVFARKRICYVSELVKYKRLPHSWAFEGLVLADVFMPIKTQE